MNRAVPRPTTTTVARAVGVDLGILIVGGFAIVLTFLTGGGVPRWHNLVIAPIVFVLAALTMRLVLAEVRALRPVLPEAEHKGEALAALGVAIAMAVIVGPMLVIMPFVFAAAL